MRSRSLWRVLVVVGCLAGAMTASRPSCAGAIDTEHLFGFTIGTDVGNVGEREIEHTTSGRLAKAAGGYGAIAQTLAVEFVPVDHLRVEFGGALAGHAISGVPGFVDRRQLAFESLSADIRYRLLDRASAPFGLTVGAESRWGRIDEVTGASARQYGVDFVVAADTEIIRDRLVAAVNLLYQPEMSRSGPGDGWSRDATIGVATALMTQVRPGIFFGGEARYLRKYDGSGFDRFEGHGLFLGPTLYLQLSRKAWLAAAWSTQIAGRAAVAAGSLDLVNFERHHARLLFGFNF